MLMVLAILLRRIFLSSPIRISLCFMLMVLAILLRRIFLFKSHSHFASLHAHGSCNPASQDSQININSILNASIQSAFYIYL